MVLQQLVATHTSFSKKTTAVSGIFNIIKHTHSISHIWYYSYQLTVRADPTGRHLTRRGQ